MRKTWFSAVVAALIVVVAAPEALAWRGCGRIGFVNRGFGYGWGWNRGWCGPGVFGPGFVGPGWGSGFGCRPCFGWRAPCFGWRAPCFGYGWPGFGGWYGGGFYSGFGSVSLAVPYGGGATFFSGSVVPFPVPVWAPCAVPPLWFGATTRPRAAVEALAAAPAPVRAAPAPARLVPTAVAAAPAPGLRRIVTVAARKRAAGLVAAGDRHLLASGGERAGLSAAAASYRRAVAAAADDPDLHIRQALVLTWLGRGGEAEAACARAVALDGRLAEEGPGRVAPVVARGRRILQGLAADLPAGDAPARTMLAAIEERWLRGAEAAPAVALAAHTQSDR